MAEGGERRTEKQMNPSLVLGLRLPAKGTSLFPLAMETLEILHLPPKPHRETKLVPFLSSPHIPPFLYCSHTHHLPFRKWQTLDTELSVSLLNVTSAVRHNHVTKGTSLTFGVLSLC